MKYAAITFARCGALALLALLVQPVRGDIVLLMDGRQFSGEVVEEAKDYVVFRHLVAGFWTNSKFTRRQIDRIVPEEGNQADGDGANAKAPENAPSTAKRDTSHLPKVVVIPLHGAVGSAGEDPIRNTFDAQMLTECLEEAKEMNARAVILDIQSPGGLVSEMEAICETILEHYGDLRIVAYPREAYSAAAIISLCCREMVVRPDSRIGAAVIIAGRAGDVTAVDAKMASPHYAKQRQYMAKSGRPYEVVAAMTIQETALWWSPEHGFTTDEPERTDAKAWSQVDGSTTVLTMTADEAVAWKLASGKASSTWEVLTRLDITGEIAIVDMRDKVDRYTSQMQQRFDSLVKQIRTYFGSLGDLRDAIVDLGEAYRNQDRDAAKRQKSLISQQVMRIQTAGRAIQKIDKTLLARRVKMPDALLDQMQADAAILGRITSLVKTDTYDGFNESVDRLNTVLEAWNALLFR